MKNERPWAEKKATLPYSVTLWCSHPDLEEDTCDTGTEFATEAEARECIQHLDLHFNMSYYRHSPFILLDAEGGLREVTVRPGVKRLREDDDDWRREQAHQAGMAGGCEAYNEVMGYD